MKAGRLALARFLGTALPPVVSNRLNLRWVYPFRLVQGDDRGLRCRSVTGSWFHGKASDVHSHMLAVHGYWDWRVVAAAGALLQSGDVAVEVGANVGTETVALADTVGPSGRVYAFEPLPSNVALLQGLVERSGLAQVEVIPLAVSDTQGPVHFVLPFSPDQSGLGHIGTAEAHPDIEVGCTTLDAALEGKGPVRLILIDTEGAEAAVLRGAVDSLRRDRPALVLEACGEHLARYGESLTSLHSALRGLGYSVHRIGWLGLRTPELQAEGYSNWVALPEPSGDLAARVHRRLLACGTLPCVRGVNPLTSRAAGPGVTVG